MNEPEKITLKRADATIDFCAFKINTESNIKKSKSVSTRERNGMIVVREYDNTKKCGRAKRLAKKNANKDKK